jgi:hypothetical protein
MWIKVNPTTSLVEAVSCCFITGMTDEVNSIPDDFVNTNCASIQQYYYIYNEFVKKATDVIDAEEFASDDNHCEVTKFYNAFLYNDAYGCYKAFLSNNTDVVQGTFPIPSDFIHVHSLSMLVIPFTTAGSQNIRMTSEYGAVGENTDQHTETDNSLTYDLVAEKITAIDISPVFSSLQADDICGFQFQNYTECALYVLGIRLKYHA